MTTKELLEQTAISEATLRRWLRDGQPVPELADAKRDWRGWREWDERHLRAILKYKERRLQQHELGEDDQQLTLFEGSRKEERDGGGKKSRSVA
jgi:hypothetical protein